MGVLGTLYLIDRDFEISMVPPELQTPDEEESIYKAINLIDRMLDAQ